MIPPVLVRLSWSGKRREHRIWLPVFLLWPIVALIIALVVMAGPVFVVLRWIRGGKCPMRCAFAGVEAYWLVCGFRGVRIDVVNGVKAFGLWVL